MKDIRLNDGGSIMITRSGRHVYPPGSKHGADDGFPSLGDIGVGLGRQPRFAGQVEHWYPVLCHVLVVAAHVSPAARPYALMHDAPESIHSDIPTPWKSQQTFEWENHLLERICRGHGLRWPIQRGIRLEVRNADICALTAEAFELQFYDPMWFVDNYFEGYSREEVAEIIRPYRDLTKKHLSGSIRDLLVAHHASWQFEDAFNVAMTEAGYNVPTTTS